MSKDLEDQKVKGAELLKCPSDKSPIFFVNITAKIKDSERSKKFMTYKAEKVVLKGTLEEMKKSDQTKKQFIREFFKRDAGAKKKVSDFDLNKIEVIDIEIIRGLGYGIKSS
jgi:hypothetical protein